MKQILKYAIYIIIALILYIVAKGFYDGRLNKETTVGDLTNEVGQDTKKIIKDGINKASENLADAADNIEVNIDEGWDIPRSESLEKGHEFDN